MIILDMENPECCSLCDMMNDEIGEKCSVKGKELDRKELLSKPAWCPIMGELDIDFQRFAIAKLEKAEKMLERLQ